MNLLEELRSLFAPVLAESIPDRADLSATLAMIKPTVDPKHGDYQANFAMGLAKKLGRKPQEIAADIVARIPANPIVDALTVAGPGFINIRLKDSWIAERTRIMAGDERLGVAPTVVPRTLVVDYCGPNVAKPLHVGHLRSTIIGEALIRILRFAGHTVVGDNHLGDWGTQFGILLYGYKHLVDKTAYAADPVAELARIYVEVRNLTKVDEDDDGNKPNLTAEQKAVVDAYRRETVRLHNGDAENIALWNEFMPHCMKEIHDVFDRLDVHPDFELGESFYHPMLPGIVEDLLSKGIAEESQGAIIVRGDNDRVSLIRKSDGAFTYTTTDLATIRYRLDRWNPDALIYVVDFRQGDHFRNLFDAARRWSESAVELSHVSFGSVLGEDGKPLKTRDGGVVELHSLLNQAIAEGERTYEASGIERIGLGREVPDFTPEERRNIARIVGIGAVKYADLSQNRTSDYKFSFEKMLSTDGNTAAYMQYAYARARAILRKGEIDGATLRVNPPAVVLIEPEERALALQLLRFSQAIDDAIRDYSPHVLTGYLWDVAKPMSSFYASKKCKVLLDDNNELRESRLVLIDLTGRVIQKALKLLGIDTIEQM